MIPPDPPEIAWAVGMPMTPWYGSRTERLVLHNTAHATDHDRAYIDTLLCRLSPTGVLRLTGDIADWLR